VNPYALCLKSLWIPVLFLLWIQSIYGGEFYSHNGFLCCFYCGFKVFIRESFVHSRDKFWAFFLLLVLVATWQAPCHISPCLFSTSYSFPFLSFCTRECLRDKPRNKFIVLDPLCKHHCVTLLSPNPEPSMFRFASLWSSGAMQGYLEICLHAPFLGECEHFFVGVAWLCEFWWLYVQL